MMRTACMWLMVAFLEFGGRACVAGAQTLNGFVTNAGTPQAFDVNGVHVTCDGGTREVSFEDRCPQRVYGETLDVSGKRETATNTLRARRIETRDMNFDLEGRPVKGVAMVDAVYASNLLRADGYAMRITAQTKVVRKPPLTADAAVASGQWIAYNGVRGTAGVIVLERVTFTGPVVTKREQRVRAATEFDAAAVTPDRKQGRISRSVNGTDFTRIPAAHDAALEARLAVVGGKLVPEFNRDLPVDDATHMSLRFQLVDEKWSDCVSLPSGIVLVPSEVVRRLQDDSELAAVVASCVATVLEKQAYRYSMWTDSTTPVETPLIAPLAELGAIAGMKGAAAIMDRHTDDQRSRITLTLLHDAGFGIEAAPIAWWRLETPRADFMVSVPPPHRSAYLFHLLATLWAPGSPLLQTAMAANAQR